MSVPGVATPGDVRLTPVHERLWRWLWACARGRAAAVPRARIHATIEGPGSEVGRTFADLSDRAFRKLTAELCEAGYPAWSNERGYFAGQDRADWFSYARYLLGKIGGIRRRLDAAGFALEAQRARVAGDPVAVQVVVDPTPDRPRRRILVPVGPIRQPSVGQGWLA